MNTRKRMTVAMLALLPLATGMACADDEHGYSRIFIFGASFMDSGNHFAVTGETAHPPFEPISFASYGVGGHRPSNGPTWVEVLAQKMNLTEWGKPAYRDPTFGNYAFSFGRARDVLPDPVEASLSDQVQAWIDNGNCTGDPANPMNDTLFIVDSGYRDLLDVTQTPDFPTMLTIMNDMAASIETNIRRLYGCGAHNLLFAYLAPLEYTPIGNAGLPPDLIEPVLSELYNGVVFTQLFLVEPLPADMNISTVNFFNFVEEIMETPESFGFSNVTDACVTPGVTNGAFCKDRDKYFWWDQLHPTKMVHALFAEFAYGQLP